MRLELIRVQDELRPDDTELVEAQRMLGADMFEHKVRGITREGTRAILRFGRRLFSLFDIDLWFVCQTRSNAELELFSTVGVGAIDRSLAVSLVSYSVVSFLGHRASEDATRDPWILTSSLFLTLNG